MAFLIITPMLGFVVDMLNTDRREQVKSNTEQDLQAAVDFIAQDLSQAIYIYNGAEIAKIKPELPESTNPDKTPILVFWKRQQIKSSLPVPINTTVNTPKECAKDVNKGKCDDTYVLALVAYYQIKDDSKNIWCQPSGNECPTRIARYQIQDGILDPAKSTLTEPSERYFTGAGVVDKGQERSQAFNIGTKDNPGFDISNPTDKVTLGSDKWDSPEVLVNYIDRSINANVPIPTGLQCQTLLGVTPPPPPATFNADDLLITDKLTYSFYACVDTSKNIARVTIRGNSLRRLQPDAPYNKDNPAFFPTASVQVQGLGARGK